MRVQARVETFASASGHAPVPPPEWAAPGCDERHVLLQRAFGTSRARLERSTNIFAVFLRVVMLRVGALSAPRHARSCAHQERDVRTPVRGPFARIVGERRRSRGREEKGGD